MNNRIGELCWYKLHYKNEDWKLGILLAWSTDYDEGEFGPGLFPVGVVEDYLSSDCNSIRVGDISFGDKEPGK